MRADIARALALYSADEFGLNCRRRLRFRRAEPAEFGCVGEVFLDLRGLLFGAQFAAVECGLQGLGNRSAIAQRPQQQERFAIDATVVDRIVVAMHREPDGRAPHTRQRRTLVLAHLGDGIACDLNLRGLLAHREHQLIDRITQVEQLHMRLQAQTRLRAETGEIILAERLQARAVVGIDVRPLQPRYIDCESVAHTGDVGILFGHRADHAEPVLLVVNFQPFERGQPVVGLHVAVGDFADGAAVLGLRLHVPVGGQGAAHVLRHSPLQIEQVHANASSNCSCSAGPGCATGFGCIRYFFAFSASPWTSSNEGILSSHSSSVAVCPTRSMARAYSFHTGSSTGWSCVSSVYFSNFEWPATCICATRSAETAFTYSIGLKPWFCEET